MAHEAARKANEVVNALRAHSLLQPAACVRLADDAHHRSPPGGQEDVVESVAVHQFPVAFAAETVISEGWRVDSPLDVHFRYGEHSL